MNAQIPAKASNGQPFGLTAQEMRIIRFICDGTMSKDMATALGVTPGTVKKHMSHLCDKLGVSSRLEVAIFAFSKGLVSVGAPGDGARHDGILLEIEEAHRKIEKYVSRSRMLVQQLSSEASQQR